MGRRWKIAFAGWIIVLVLFNGAMALRARAEDSRLWTFCQDSPNEEESGCFQARGRASFGVLYFPWVWGDILLILVPAGGVGVLRLASPRGT